MNTEAPKIHYPFQKPASGDWLIFGVVMLAGVIYAWYIYNLGLTLFMVDQYSHLAISRQVIDSMTPGISQLGFWPPLVHILIAPFTAIDWLYHTGLAAAAVLVPLLAVSAVFLYHLVLLLTNNRPVSAVAVAAYVLNPYILYYSVTPMSDTLFVGLLIMATYFLLHWWITGRLLSLVWLGAIGSLATLARFEGFFLVGFAGLMIIAKLVRNRVSYQEVEANTILYGLMAALGVVFIVMYGIVFAGDPLAFMNNEWGAYSQQRSFFLPTEHNIVESTRYLMAASVHMIGLPLIILALISVVFLVWNIKRTRLLFTAMVLMLASPFIFDLFALFQGSAVIYLPELPPHDPRFFNERYGLYWIAFAVVMPALMAAYLYERVRRIDWYFEPVAAAASGLVLVVMVYGSYSLFADVSCQGCFNTVYGSLQTSPPDHANIASILREEHRPGERILMTRALNNEIAIRSEVPLRSYILEANEHYFDHALVYPWLFADWVVMQNNKHEDHSAWSLQNEQIALLWTDNEDFERFYEPVFIGNGSILYKLREGEVERFASQNGLAIDEVPSLGHSDEPWDVEETFESLQTQLERSGATTQLVHNQ